MQLTDDERKDREERIEKRKRAFLLKHCGERYEKASLSQIERSFGQESQILIRNWIKSKKNFLVIIGAPGTGKTFACAAIISEAIKYYNTVRFWKEADLFSHLRESIDRYDDYSKSLALALDDDFCIVDDIGSTPVNEWRKEIIFTTIDTRYQQMKPTIFTSNLNKEELKKRYEWRTTDRLFAKENTVIDLLEMQSLREEGL